MPVPPAVPRRMTRGVCASGRWSVPQLSLLLFIYILYPKLADVFLRARTAPAQTESAATESAPRNGLDQTGISDVEWQEQPITVVPNDYRGMKWQIKIRLLPEVVANQIAAGEVVNRPASVVKEMMENAIDAGARTVKVNFRDGGKDLIQIVDDGSGMSPIDARMAFDRHATSKITSVEDIYALDTFGFRGEALASIAAVAQVELRTRQEGDEVGTQTEINGGQFAGQTPVMCPVGAQFFVRNLFYNVPARRRFLDKSTTSAAQIKAEFQRVALCNPHIAFELYANDAPVYTLCATSLAGRIVDVVGRHIKQNLLEVDADTSIARIGGYIGRPAAAKRRNGEQYLFVNGRYFKSSYLTSAIMKAYEKLIPESSSPSYFLYLTIDPSRIDVNVHPQKTEVKFADEEAVWQIINAAVRETLAKTGAVPLMDFDRDGIVEIPALSKGAVYSEPRAMSNGDYNPFREEYIDPDGT